MSSSIDIPLRPLPVPSVTALEPGISLLQPLSRKGSGPGMVVLVPDSALPTTTIDNGAPSPALKWAEEGYTVIEIRELAINSENLLGRVIEALRGQDKCTPKGSIGVVAYSPTLWNKVASTDISNHPIAAAAIYTTVTEASTLQPASIPTVRHLAGQSSSKLQRTDTLMEYNYPSMNTAAFPLSNSSEFHYGTEAISHTRNITFLKKHMNGPYFDLEAIWEEHTYFEFENRSVEHTMSTMVQEPYVNDIPTLTGGIGRDNLTRFYRDHFIFKNPQDSKMELISRTIGIDRVVDEFILILTHDSEIDWLIPGIPPTGRKLEIPFTSVVNIRGDRLYHEHISWDQATVLVQLGLMPEYVPFPYAMDRQPAPGKRFEVRVPAVGAETAAKMRDKNAVPSNQLFTGGIREV